MSKLLEKILVYSLGERLQRLRHGEERNDEYQDLILGLQLLGLRHIRSDLVEG